MVWVWSYEKNERDYQRRSTDGISLAEEEDWNQEDVVVWRTGKV